MILSELYAHLQNVYYVSIVLKLLLPLVLFEESAEHQVIEVQHDNTYKMRLKYRISGRSITPLYYKIDASMGLVIYLLPIFIFSVWLGWFTSRRSVRWVKPAIEAVRSNASQKL